MALKSGMQLGPYEITAPIGAGGMGEVYRATDTKLKREVAIKVLPEEVGRDRERLGRFEREAQVLASLNHPNIASIYGLEEAGDAPCLVLELVEGQTLAERLAQGPLPLEEAREIALQVASALEAAHEKGIVHRDLKPANVKVTPEGTVKVLDFGLAKAMADESAETAQDVSMSPTLTAATRAGVILGTAAYMSPEQARGKSVDKRGDIWAFGCVVFECLTARQCFGGETVSDLIAHVLQTEPDWEALPAETPGRIRRLLRRCLEKDRRRRLHDIADARIELEDEFEQDVLRPGTATSAPAAMAWPGRARLALSGLVLAAASALVTLGVLRVLHPVPERTPLRFQIADAKGMDIDADSGNSSISPDGSMLVFLARNSAGQQQLWVRSLETLAARPLEGTDEAYQPFWSPDGRDIGFFSVDKLKRVPADGGAVEELCDSGRARGGTWNRENVILFASSDSPLFKVSASGGRPEPVTNLDTAAGETGHRFPHFLPDGRHYLYSSLPPKDGKFDIYVGELGSTEREFLLSADSGVVCDGAGHLLYQRNGSLAVQQFDASSLRPGDEPVLVRESMAMTQWAGGPGFSVSSSGVLAYTTLELLDTRLAWFDLEGREVAPVPIDPAPYTDLALSPDDRRVALVRRTSSSRSDLWIGDLERGVVARFSEEPGQADQPRWSPDGTRIAYHVSQMGPGSFVVRAVDGGSEARTLLGNDMAYKNQATWSPDGRSLVYASQDPETSFDLWVLPLDGDQEPWLYLASPFMEFGSAVSPDGRWLAYVGFESGHAEAYVQPFPDPGRRYQVTKGEGYPWRWLAGGNQLVFWSRSSPTILQVANVIPGDEFRLGPARTFGILPRGQLRTKITADGERILSLVPVGEPVPTSITVVLNWAEDLEKD